MITQSPVGPLVTDERAAELDDAPSTQNMLRELLENRAALTATIEAGGDLKPIVLSLAAIVMLGGGVFGASLGLGQGLWRSGLVALELPVLALAAAAVCAPAVYATRAVLLRESHFLGDFARVLAAFARASVVLMALAPVMLLAVSWELPPHHLIGVGAGCGVVAGLIATTLLWQGSTRRQLAVFSATVVVVATVTVQMARTFGPFVAP